MRQNNDVATHTRIRGHDTMLPFRNSSKGLTRGLQAPLGVSTHRILNPMRIYNPLYLLIFLSMCNYAVTIFYMNREIIKGRSFSEPTPSWPQCILLFWIGYF
jgi:hypothetical protein